MSTLQTDQPYSNLRVLTHNVGQDLTSFDVINSLVLDSNSDIVLLQEIIRDCVQQSWPTLTQRYPFQAHGPFLSDKHVGMGVLSRFPILDISNFKLDAESLVFQQRINILVGQTIVVLYNIHLTNPWIRFEKLSSFFPISIPKYNDSIRRREIAALIKKIEVENSFLIIAGDFNLSEHSGDYSKLTEILTDSFEKVGTGFGFTWPANRTPSLYLPFAKPIIRIDYLFYSPSLIKPISAHVMPKTGSDHLPLLVDLALPNN